MNPTTDNHTENPLFNLAAEVIRYTSCNLFLTGKAGTGKTTFLKFIKDYANKNCVIVAPTGVAAINAGGVTMHSFFQLPFNPYLPAETLIFGNNATVDKHGLLRGLRFNREKTTLINELELLIIDEVSMVRADMLQAIDDILRHVRRSENKPFGGVQVLFIGDLFQLPPVVSDQEWTLMKSHYATPYFFSAKTLEQQPPLFIELKTIYRQSDPEFINLLNNIRNNSISESDLKLLQNMREQHAITEDEHIITLTTHNRVADRINQTQLSKLAGNMHQFNGIIQGEFSDKALPADQNLQLKPGAQVMFIKNDSGPEKKYYNGLLATVEQIGEDEVLVRFNNTGELFEVSREKWSNIRYTLNKENGKLEEEEIGSYLQYPLRLAWAITIHKSQGLTFDRVQIDAGASFAPGQVYVALSRCRTLQGIRLLSPISPHNIRSDERIVQFSNREQEEAAIRQRLEEEKPLFSAQLLVKTFDWRKVVVELEHYHELASGKKFVQQEMISGVTAGLLERSRKQQETADKFIKQLDGILKQPDNQTILDERVTKAKHYFGTLIQQELMGPVNELKAFLKGKVKVKQFSRATDDLDLFLWKKLSEVQRITFGELRFEVPVTERPETGRKDPANHAAKPKENTKLLSLEFYRQGMTVAEIAAQRGITAGTVESHLSDFVGSGEVNIFDFITQAWLDEIETVVVAEGFLKYTALKEKVHPDISYGQLRMACNYLKAKHEPPVTK